MLQFDDSCYVDAKQYHSASFSIRNATLNTSLRKPIRMQDFIQLCDSTKNLLVKFADDITVSLPIEANVGLDESETEVLFFIERSENNCMKVNLTIKRGTSFTRKDYQDAS